MLIVVLHNEQTVFSNEHSGFSLLIKHKRARILFDFSHKKDVFENANKIKLDINKDINFFVLSHGHIDHLENMQYLELKKRTPLILHPQALIPKFVNNQNICFTKPLIDSLCQFNLMPLKKPFFIKDDIVFLGEITNENRIPTGNNCFGKDYILDDSALLINTKKYPVLVTGCAHSGIINLIKQADKIFNRNVGALVGGLHLFGDDNQAVFDFLKKRKIKVLFCHCFDKKNEQKLKKINSIKMNTLDSFKF